MSVGSRSRPLRVLHLPALVGGHAAGLARAERALGLDSRTLALHPPPYGYKADEVLFPPGTRRLGREARRLNALRRLARADVVHFNFGSTLLPRWHPDAHPLQRLYARLLEDRDLAWLRRRGTAVFVTYQGDDARQGGARFDAILPPGYFDPRLDRSKRRSIARVERSADGIFALNPDLLDVLPARAEFLPYASVDPADWRPAEHRPARVPVVVHAPSDRRVKGTEHVLAAVEAVRAGGLEVELVLVEGMSRDEARRLYERADLFVDQLLTGWYGGAAVELMALGKPVVAYLDDGDLARVPSDFAAALPIVRADPASVASVLATWLGPRRAELADLGRRSRAFVELHHDPRAIAARLKAAYERSVANSSTST
jgi:glycosyltransferase involved in cell wall biosynthesis